MPDRPVTLVSQTPLSDRAHALITEGIQRLPEGHTVGVIGYGDTDGNVYGSVVVRAGDHWRLAAKYRKDREQGHSGAFGVEASW